MLTGGRRSAIAVWWAVRWSSGDSLRLGLAARVDESAAQMSPVAARGSGLGLHAAGAEVGG